LQEPGYCLVAFFAGLVRLDLQIIGLGFFCGHSVIIFGYPKKSKMKKLFPSLFFLLLFSPFSVKAQNQNQQYDSTLSKKLNADPYGMKQYVLVLLKTGEAKITDKGKRDSIFNGHMHNIGRLASEGKLVLAGPFDKNDKKYEGIFVLNTDDLNLANAWIQTDPAVQAKLLDADLYNWYSSAALQQVPSIHEKIWKSRF